MSFARKHLREISFILGTITFKEWLEILSFLSLERKNLIDGKYIKQFESEFSRYIGTKHAFSFGAGRMAFYAILKAMGIKEGDEVILPGYTCVVVPNAIIYCGAKPVYVDIDQNTFTIDINKIEDKITPKTKAIVAQHMFDQICDLDGIFRIAKKHDLKVIEDCAHALGGTYNGKKVGTFGDAAFFSFEQSKIITTWMGGMAITDDDALAEKLHAIQKDTEFSSVSATRKIAFQIIFYYMFGHPNIKFIGKIFLYFLNKLGLLIQNVTSEEMESMKPEKYPILLSNIQAKIGLNQLRNIDINIQHRKKIAQIYEEALGIRSHKQGYDPPYIRYALLVKDREKLRKLFQDNQVELGEWFNSPIHPKGASREKVHYQDGTCPIAEFVAEHVVNLPTHLYIREKDAKEICEIIRIAKEGGML